MQQGDPALVTDAPRVDFKRERVGCDHTRGGNLAGADVASGVDRRLRVDEGEQLCLAQRVSLDRRDESVAPVAVGAPQAYEGRRMELEPAAPDGPSGAPARPVDHAHR